MPDLRQAGRGAVSAVLLEALRRRRSAPLVLRPLRDPDARAGGRRAARGRAQGGALNGTAARTRLGTGNSLRFPLRGSGRARLDSAKPGLYKAALPPGRLPARPAPR